MVKFGFIIGVAKYYFWYATYNQQLYHTTYISIKGIKGTS
jgi:hypothetical protein